MFRSIIIAALAVAGVAAAAPALAEDYVLLDVSDDYSDMTVLDYSSIAVDHDQVKKAWLVTISVGPAIEDNVVRSHTLWLFDCPNSKAAIRTMQLYADVDQAPTDDLTLQDSELDWNALQPNTLGGSAGNYVCGTVTPTADDMITVPGDVELHRAAIGIYEQKKSEKPAA